MNKEKCPQCKDGLVVHHPDGSNYMICFNCDYSRRRTLRDFKGVYKPYPYKQFILNLKDKYDWDEEETLDNLTDLLLCMNNDLGVDLNSDGIHNIKQFAKILLDGVWK